MSAKTFTLSPDQELAILKLWNSGEDKNLYINEIMKFGVMMTPALVIDGDVKVVGKVPSSEDIKEMFT